MFLNNFWNILDTPQLWGAVEGVVGLRGIPLGVKNMITFQGRLLALALAAGLAPGLASASVAGVGVPNIAGAGFSGLAITGDAAAHLPDKGALILASSQANRFPAASARGQQRSNGHGWGVGGTPPSSRRPSVVPEIDASQGLLALAALLAALMFVYDSRRRSRREV